MKKVRTQTEYTVAFIKEGIELRETVQGVSNQKQFLLKFKKARGVQEARVLKRSSVFL